METEEAILDDQKIKIVTKIPEEKKEDEVLNINLEDTVDLSNLNLDNANQINIGDLNE